MYQDSVRIKFAQAAAIAVLSSALQLSPANSAAGTTPAGKPDAGNTIETNLSGVAAFPGAFGYGAERRDWSDAKIVFVTRLSDSNPPVSGELRYAINKVQGPRIVIFKVGGTIRTTRTLFIEAKDKDLYIAGQTAPGGGITLRGDSRDYGKDLIRLVETRNVVLRYLRLRLGKGPEPGTGDNISIIGSQNILLDHLSLSWSNDENLGIYTGKGQRTRNLSIQNNLLAEPLAPHAANFLVTTEVDFRRRANALHLSRNVTNLSIHRNIFAHATHRAPMIAATRAFIANNLTYNWKLFALGTLGPAKVDYVNNILIEGPASRVREFNVFAHQTFTFNPKDPPRDRYDVDDPKVYYLPLASIYNEGNYRDYFRPRRQDGVFDAWPEYVERVGLSQRFYACDGTDWRCLKNNRRNRPMPDRSQHPYPIRPADDALRERVLGEAGASRRLTCAGSWVANRDAVDQRIISEIKDKQSRFTATPAPTTPAAVGGYATIDSGKPCRDTDNDGLPDRFEIIYGLNLARDDAHTDPDRDGYTNIEEYLNATPPTLKRRVSL